MKKCCFVMSLVCILLILSGCATTVNNPLLHAETTDVPGLSMNVQAAKASEDNADQVNVSLYFRYLDEPMLAAESRTLTVRRDESTEYAIIRALLAGPSAGHSDLKRLLPESTTIESINSLDGILFITVGEGFLSDGVPQDWREDDAWKEEAPILRQLIVQSMVASITEYAPYRGVQILVRKADQSSLRLDNAYFLNDSSGVSDPALRDEALLLTPQNTAMRILLAWQTRDYQSLYNYLLLTDRPSYADTLQALDPAVSLSAFTVSGGAVSGDGQRAIVTLDTTVLDGSEPLEQLAYPLPLIRENGIWKISYAALLALMQQ